MEPDNLNQEAAQVEPTSSLHQVTPLSKYLAMGLFILLPFVGGYIGYTFAPEKVIEIEKEVIREVEAERIVEVPVQSTEDLSPSGEMYESRIGYSILLPSDVTTQEGPAQFSNSALTRYEGDFGSLCISPAYGCGGVGLQGWAQSADTIFSADGTEMKLTMWTRGEEVYITLDSLQPVPAGFSSDAQIQLLTSTAQLETAKSILSSITFSE